MRYGTFGERSKRGERNRKREKEGSDWDYFSISGEANILLKKQTVGEDREVRRY